MSIDDPIAAAHRLAAIELRIRVLKPAVKFAGPNSEPASDRPGVVVVREIGGTSSTTTGKEAQAEFKNIVGKRLPLAPVMDLAAARRTLYAEFPYTIDQIDLLLADLIGAEFVRLKPPCSSASLAVAKAVW